MSLKTILIVDDEFAIRELLEVLLEGRGYKTLLAQNGARALELMNQVKVDLVVSDVMMPVMDGRALLAAMSADERFSGIPLVFITAVPSRVLKTDAAAVVAKPFNAERLVQTVVAVLEGTGTT
jgi:CheY-like chemotaxis protein